jgi:glycosidase
MNHHWSFDSIFYHIYPLGFCGAPTHQDFQLQPRLEKIYGWLDHIQSLGANALYLGPLFQSTEHGYDTSNYFVVDQRLGTNQTLHNLSVEMHRRGFRLILDGVFNHVGRDFWAFQDVLSQGERSPYWGWFSGLRYGGSTPYGDPFTYDCWNGHYNLVKLNLRHPAVINHLLQAVTMWIEQFDIDGLRLDAADCVAREFLKILAAHCRSIRPDFWLMGEVIHGDYRQWANADTLDSVTNYECYKGLYSSHVDHNYFEIAYALNRQFGAEGMYRDLPLYNFADNHDVNRVVSNLKNSAHLYPLYCLLFTMPGVPSIYYGSEWGIAGDKQHGGDPALRPALDLANLSYNGPHADLPRVIGRLAQIRRDIPALRYGDYQQIKVDHEQFIFARQLGDQSVIIAVNASDQPVKLNFQLPQGAYDILNPDAAIGGSPLHIDPAWARIVLLNPQTVWA